MYYIVRRIYLQNLFTNNFCFRSCIFQCHYPQQDVEDVYGIQRLSNVNYTQRICSTQLPTDSLKRTQTKKCVRVAVISSSNNISSILVSRIEKEKMY
jgi:hypothetical protein